MREMGILGILFITLVRDLLFEKMKRCFGGEINHCSG